MRRGNLADFEATNIILASGEPCYVIDDNRFVIGDGQTTFVDLPILNAEVAEKVRLNVKNTSGNTLTKGTPVYVTGTTGATDVLEISAADASDPLTMPAVGLLEQDLDNNGIGHIIVGGLLKHIPTDPIDGTTPSESDVLYVKAGGGLTTIKPTGVSNLIQNVGKVGKVSGGNSGSIIVSSIMRTNDVPNAISCESLTVAGVPITGSGGGSTSNLWTTFVYRNIYTYNTSLGSARGYVVGANDGQLDNGWAIRSFANAISQGGPLSDSICPSSTSFDPTLTGPSFGNLSTNLANSTSETYGFSGFSAGAYIINTDLTFKFDSANMERLYIDFYSGTRWITGITREIYLDQDWYANTAQNYANSLNLSCQTLVIFEDSTSTENGFVISSDRELGVDYVPTAGQVHIIKL